MKTADSVFSVNRTIPHGHCAEFRPPYPPGKGQTRDYWIDGQHRSTITITVDLAKEASLDHLELTSQEGSAFFDDVTVTSGPLAVCGDGVVEGTEQCDDGNTNDGDCCSACCQFEPADSACADGDLCNGDETCDSAGSCDPGTALLCDDDNLCTQDYCDAEAGCSSTGMPLEGCLSAEKVSFKIKIDPRIARSKDDDHDADSDNELSWKWRRGETLGDDELGDPLTETTYALCVYDSIAGTASLRGALHIDPNGAWHELSQAAT